MKRFGNIALVALAAGCGADATSVRTRTVTAQDIEALAQGRRFTIDTTDPDVGYVLALETGRAAFERVHLICPNGAGMAFETWLAEQRPPDSIVTDGSRGIYVGQRPSTTADPCEEDCWTCEDGLTICTNHCRPPSLRAQADARRGWGLGPDVPPGPPGPAEGSGSGAPGEPGTGPDTGDPNDGGRPGDQGSGGTSGGGSGGSGGGSGGSGGSGGTPGGQGGGAGGNGGGSSGTGGGRGLL